MTYKQDMYYEYGRDNYGLGHLNPHRDFIGFWLSDRNICRTNKDPDNPHLQSKHLIEHKQRIYIYFEE